MNWIKKISINGSLLIVSVSVVIIVIEIILRFTSFGALVSSARSLRYYYKSDDISGYDISPNMGTTTHSFGDASYSVWSNELGCFDVSHNKENPYILLVGDSFTWGFTPFPDKWGTLLEEHLNERVVKCGVSGYGTKQQLQKIQELLKFLPKPEMIVVGYYKNDENDDFIFPNKFVSDGWLVENQSTQPGMKFAENYCIRYKPAHPVVQYIKCFLRRNSILYLLTQSAVKSVIPKNYLQSVGVVNVPPGDRAPSENDLENHLKNIKQLEDLAKSIGSKLFFVLIPDKVDVMSTGTSTTYSAVRNFLDSEGLEYFYPLDEFREVQSRNIDLYWEHDIHLNISGNHLLGLLVSQNFLKNNYISNKKEIENIRDSLEKDFIFK